MPEIEKAAKEKNFKIKKFFVVLKTFDSFSTGNLDEKAGRDFNKKKGNITKFKDMLKKTRFKNNRIAFHVYGDRDFSYEYSEKEDEANIFGFFRKKVKEIVIEDILNNSEKKETLK